jgi:hypothetical protein
MSVSTGFSSHKVWASTIEKIFNCPDAELESTVLHIYGPATTLTVNGNIMNYEAFLGFTRGIKSAVVSCTVTPLFWVRDGNKFAEKHRVDGTVADGSTVKIEAMTMGELDDEGRAVTVDEIFRVVEGKLPGT